MKKVGYSVLAILVVFLIFGLIGGEDTETEKRARQDRECFDEIAAFVFSQQAVENRLRSPSTADFPGITHRDVAVRSLGDCRHTVIAFVDAQNGFGATVRTYYSTIMEYRIAQDTWYNLTSTLAMSQNRTEVIAAAVLAETAFRQPSPTKPSVAAPKPDPQRELVRSIQQKLQDKGFDPGPPDGRMGPRTRSAIERFQLSSGVLVTGEPSNELLDQLSK